MPGTYPSKRETDPWFPHLQLGNTFLVKIKKIIQRRIRHAQKGVNAVGDVNAVIAANVNEGGSRTHVSSRSRQRIIQRSGRITYASEEADEAEPSTPAIDEDVAGSVNAALPDADDD
jgi:hypothetical protein